MSNAIQLNIVSLDYQGIKNSLIQSLQNQTVFSDYAFSGAGLNILLDILVKNTVYESFYVNAVASEIFLDSCSLLDSAVSRAKEIGYTPFSMTAAQANVMIVVTPPSGNTTSTLTIPTYTQFQSEAINGVNYSFVTLQSYGATKNLISNTFTFPGVSLYEGEKLSFDFTATPTNLSSIFTIPSANIDTSTLTVQVQNSLVDTNTRTFIENSDITTLNANSQIFFVQGQPGGQYGIYFGDGYLGTQLSNGNIVITDYIVTDGPAANYANTFTLVGTVGGYSNISVITNEAASGGALAETIDQIRFRAPIAYTAQGRNVSVPDYMVNVLDGYPFLSQVAVWGGEDNVPPVYGKVFLSLVPVSGFAISNATKNQIILDLTKGTNVVSITPVIVDPNYVYILLNDTVYFDPSITVNTDTDIQNLAVQAIKNYVANNLGQFSSTFTNSGLSRMIDVSDPSIRNDDLQVILQTQLTPTLNTSLNYTLEYNTPLHQGGPGNKLYTFPAFQIADNNGIVHDSYVDEVPFSYTGIQDILVSNPGSGFTSPPNLVITGDGIGANATATIVNGKINSVKVNVSGIDYTVAEITVQGGGGSGAVLTPVLSGQNGTLEIFHYQNNGEKIITNSNVGTIDYLNGIIQLYNFSPISISANPYYSSGIITFNIQPDNQTIPPYTNQIMTVDLTNPIAIQVSVVEI